MTQATLQAAEAAGTLRLVNPGSMTASKPRRTPTASRTPSMAGRITTSSWRATAATWSIPARGTTSSSATAAWWTTWWRDGDPSDIDLIESLAVRHRRQRHHHRSRRRRHLGRRGRRRPDRRRATGRTSSFGDNGRITAAVANAPDCGSQPLTPGLIETVGLRHRRRRRDRHRHRPRHRPGRTRRRQPSWPAGPASPGPATTTSYWATTGSCVYDRDLNSADIDEIASTSTTSAGGSDTITSAGRRRHHYRRPLRRQRQRRRRQEHRHRRQRPGAVGHRWTPSSSCPVSR